MLGYVLAAVVVVISLLLAWAVGLIGALSGVPLLLTRVLLLLLGIAGAVLLVLRERRRHTAGPKTPEATALDTLLNEAEGKLAASSRASGRRLRALPLLYVLGEADAAKTTAVLKGGLEPELLAGEVYRDRDVVPTPLANVWYTESAVLIEAGQAVRDNPVLWNRLVLRTRPDTFRSAFGQATPFRAAVLCVSCEQLLKGTNTEALQAAAAAQGVYLRQLARLLGSQVPVYVLLTKLDRVAGFAEYVRNLTPEEASSLLGGVPLVSGTGGASYAERASAAIAGAYDTLIFSLAEARLDLLNRENDPALLGQVYEFPRELRKFRDALTTYLVELARPSHLNVNPHLRGFFFTGVRAYLRQISASAPGPLPVPQQADAGATGVFSFQAPAQPLSAPMASGGAEKIAQWTFLPRFFPHAVLGDKDALAITTGSSHGLFLRRLLYGGLAALLLIYLSLLTVSYMHNAALERSIESASTALASAPSGTGTLATVNQLTLLDGLREHLVQLEAYRDQGPPMSYRWGLYRGDLLLQPTRQLYFSHFRSLLLNRTQTNILASLNALPATPTPGADYNTTYAALRAYLITTNHPDKSTPDFLSPVLEPFWQNGAALDSTDQQQLAMRQFDFYARELPTRNPYNIAPVDATVTHTRAYLASFGGFERIYQSMLTAAEKAAPPIDFNQQHPGSAETVVEPHVIPAAFTKRGFVFMQDALANSDRFFKGESWVLGDQAPPSINVAGLQQQLLNRYHADYLAQWRAFLKDATVVHYRDLKDAGAKLTVLSGNNSPLLALLATVSQNTSVGDPQISNAFQAPQALVPGAGDVYIAPSNKTYVDALLTLNSAINQVTQNPAGASDPAAAAPVSAAASAAHLASQQSAQAFHLDPQAHLDATTLALMEAPIASAEALVHGLGPAAANAGGKSFCAAFASTFAKVPFNPQSSVQATPAEVTALLQPGTGALWQFYNSNLKALLVQQGAEYGVAPNPPMQVNPAFLHFFNRAASLSQTIFPPGATAPALTFGLRNLPSDGIQTTQVKVDTQTLTNAEASKQFTWNAQTAQTASLTANNLPLTFEGPWAVFLMLGKAKAQKVGAAYNLSFPLEVANTPVKAPDGTPVVARFELSGPGAEVLAPGALSGLHCVGVVSH